MPHSLHTEPVARGTDRAADNLLTSELQRQSLAQTKALVGLELGLARQQLLQEIRQRKSAGVLLGIAGVLAIVAVAMFDVAVVIALGNTVTAALIVAFIVVAEVALLAFLGYRKLKS